MISTLTTLTPWVISGQGLWAVFKTLFPFVQVFKTLSGLYAKWTQDPLFLVQAPNPTQYIY
jgi:hypothetical protein